MTMPLPHRLLAFLLVTLVAVGCASSSDPFTSDTASDTATSDPITSDAAATTPDDGAPTPDDGAGQSNEAELDDNPTPQALDADPNSTARDFVRLRFNIDPDADGIDCMVAESEGNDVLELALQTPSVAAGDVNDAQMRALTYAMNGCVEAISLGDWATQAIGPQGEVGETAPACFAERFDDAETGDATFYNFVALTFQFRLDPAGSDRLVDTLATCAPITSLTDFFASQAEIATNFSTLVDRGCLDEALSPTAASEDFWGVFVSGEMPPVAFIAPYIEQCASNANAELADAVPDDFEAWSGTGALALVAPAARNQVYDTAPPMTVDPAVTYEAIIATGGGEIRVRLLVETAPIAVNNFVSLARDGFYDRTVFHRVLDGFMAQGGDPTGTGMGGPGYQFDDEFDGGPALDRKGLMAMANTGANSNGSQFFLTFDETDWLTGNHTVFGEVVDGLDILDAIERRDPDAPTSRGQVIDSVTIIES